MFNRKKIVLVVGFAAATILSSAVFAQNSMCVTFCDKAYQRCVAGGNSEANCMAQREQCLGAC